MTVQSTITPTPALYLANFDGACGPRNPGGAGGWGFFILGPDGTDVRSEFGGLPSSPNMTNNVAEYAAALECLRAFVELHRPGRLVLRGDSQLVIEQMSGRRKARRGAYLELHHRTRAFVVEHGLVVEWEWVSRDANARADALSKMGLEAALKTKSVE